MKSCLIRALPEIWSRGGLLAWLLSPLSLLFQCLSALRRGLYAFGILRSARLPVPVIVVGNISAGGSGKTPVVIHLCQHLSAAGLRPGVISRGYGGRANRASDPLEVRAQSDPQEVGDEPLLIKRRTGVPVFIARHRARAGAALLVAHPEVDVIIADDGLQHLALERDIEIVVMDGRGIGNGWLLPAGPLRERPARLSEVDAVIFHGEVDPALQSRVQRRRRFNMSLAGENFHCLDDSGRVASASDFSGTQEAVAGIGHPDRFFDHLRALGLAINPHAFPDHHAFCATDLAFDGEGAILMTEKDGVKCAPFASARMWALRVDARIEPDLTAFVLELLDGCKTAGSFGVPGVQGPA